MSGAAVSSARGFPPEAAERQGLRAGVVSRFGAMVIDLLYAVVLLGAAYLAVAGFRLMRSARTFTWPQPSFALTLAVGAVVIVLMLAMAWSSTGHTVGMRMMGLRLVGRRGRHVRPLASFLRAVTCVAFPLGLLWSAVSRRNASVQDLIFGTSVVYDWHMRVPGARADRATPGVGGTTPEP
ncbi:MAG: RDD family protein [Actinomycetota bacterium]